jgi:acyl carrier protein
MSGEMKHAEGEIVDALASFVQGETAPGTAIAIGPDTDIIGEGLVDSVGIFKLIAFAEERFAVTIEPDEVLLDNFRTLGTFANMIGKKLAGERGKPLPSPAQRADPT